MTRRGSFPTQFALPAMLMIVLLALLAAAVSSSASATLSHFQLNGPSTSHFKANGPFTDDPFSCNANGACGQLLVSFNAAQPGESSQPFIVYGLTLPNGEFFQGFGTIPNENITNIDSKTLTLAPTDTSTIANFSNLVCDINGCTNAPGGIVSGTWKQINLTCGHSTFTNVMHSGPADVQTISNGSSDSCSANAQFSVLGNGFQSIGDIGTQHNTAISIQVP